MVHTPSERDFVSRFEERWNSYENQSSLALRSVWAQMASVYSEAINKQDNIWRVLQPPTGTGKTQGLIVYASMLAELNQSGNDGSPVGMIIVTRQIEDADSIASEINHLHPGAAISKHSQNGVTALEAQQYPVLVITHAAYVKAASSMKKDGYTNHWEGFIYWSPKQTQTLVQRRLTVIDEALDNVIEHVRVSEEQLRKAYGAIPWRVTNRHYEEVEGLNNAARLLQKINGVAASENRQERVLWRDGSDSSLKQFRDCDFAALIEALQKDMKDADRRTNASHAETIETIRDLTLLLDLWAFYSKDGKRPTMSCASLLVPDDFPGPVVLDATASKNMLWTLFEKRCLVYPVNQKARSYRCVRLHVVRCGGLGKNKMREVGRERFLNVASDLGRRLDPYSSVFVCCHKDLKQQIERPSSINRWDIGHFHAIDGKNQWRDCDTAVILGLPYRPDYWAVGTFFALQGVQGDDWLSSPVYSEFQDIRREMQTRQLSVSLIQAINRVRCRKVIDAEGNCMSTDVFLALPKGKQGDEILDHIEQSMPAIQIRDWDVAIDHPKPKQPRRDSSSERLLVYLEEQDRDEIAAAKAQRDLAISPGTWNRRVVPFLSSESTLSSHLRDRGWQYVPGSRGRGNHGRLMRIEPMNLRDNSRRS